MMNVKRALGGLAVAALLTGGAVLIPATAANATQAQDTMVKDTNKKRTNAGVPKLDNMKSMNNAAQKFAEKKFRGDFPLGDIKQSCTLNPGQELHGTTSNVSKSKAPAFAVQKLWEKKQFRAVMKDESYTHMGAGFEWKNGTGYVVLAFFNCTPPA